MKTATLSKEALKYKCTLLNVNSDTIITINHIDEYLKKLNATDLKSTISENGFGSALYI